jgi:hypothetical protein
MIQRVLNRLSTSAESSKKIGIRRKSDKGAILIKLDGVQPSVRTCLNEQARRIASRSEPRKHDAQAVRSRALRAEPVPSPMASPGSVDNEAGPDSSNRVVTAQIDTPRALLADNAVCSRADHEPRPVRCGFRKEPLLKRWPAHAPGASKRVRDRRRLLKRRRSPCGRGRLAASEDPGWPAVPNSEPS